MSFPNSVNGLPQQGSPLFFRREHIHRSREEEPNRSFSIAHPLGARPRLIINTDSRMAWRPYENLIDGELDNRKPGQVVGWLRFFRSGKRPLKVSLNLRGDFHEDIRGKVIRLKNPDPSDRDKLLGRDGTYMEGFSPVQSGVVGDITAGVPLGRWTEAIARNLMTQHEATWDEIGLNGPRREQLSREYAEQYRDHIKAGDPFYAHVNYPYIEWHSDLNGRVVLELEPWQLQIDRPEEVHTFRRNLRELVESHRIRSTATADFLAGLHQRLCKMNRK